MWIYYSIQHLIDPFICDIKYLTVVAEVLHALFFPTYWWSIHLDQQESLQIIIYLSLVQFLFFSLIRFSGFRLLILFTLSKIFSLGKITFPRTFRRRPKKRLDFIRTSPYDPICNAKGGICRGASLGPTQDVNLTIIHTMSF